MGAFRKKSIDSLKVIGKWMDVNGEAIYGTKASPFEKLSWGRCSQKSLARWQDSAVLTHL